MFCINCRSINANWGSFTELILNISSDRFHFDFIGLTEVFKVHDGTNYSIEGYHDIESNTRGDTDDGHGGVALYINETMSFFRRDDLSIFIPHVIETIFVEIKVNETKSVIVGVTYRPNSFPRADIDLFIQKITEVANIISLENEESYLMGDFNIDLLKFQTHDKTNYFINCMITTGFLPVITKPSRITDHSATLIDHIYSNNTIHNYISGLIITDVSDHFGPFCINRKKEPIKAPTFTYIRKISEINIAYFKQILSATDFRTVLSQDCPNEAYDTFIEIYTIAFNTAFPLRRIKLRRKFIKREPWMTQGLLNSSIHKAKLLRIKIRNPNELNKNKYKNFCILFNKVKRRAKATYFSETLAQNVFNIKRTWEVLRLALNSKSKKYKHDHVLLIDNRDITNSKDIADAFNSFFSNIGSTISENVPLSPNNYTDYLTENYPAWYPHTITS